MLIVNLWDTIIIAVLEFFVEYVNAVIMDLLGFGED